MGLQSHLHLEGGFGCALLGDDHHTGPRCGLEALSEGASGKKACLLWGAGGHQDNVQIPAQATVLESVVQNHHRRAHLGGMPGPECTVLLCDDRTVRIPSTVKDGLVIPIAVGHQSRFFTCGPEFSDEPGGKRCLSTSTHGEIPDGNHGNGGPLQGENALVIEAISNPDSPLESIFQG
jgi:hypothetical protein